MDRVKKLEIGEAVTIIVASLFIIASGYSLLVLPPEYHIGFLIFMVFAGATILMGDKLEEERKEITKNFNKESKDSIKPIEPKKM